MTAETIDGLRQLLNRTTDAEDIELLRTFLAVAEAAENDGQPTSNVQRCAKCKRLWSGLKLDGDGVCPNCLLDALYLRQRAWRKSQYLED